MGGAGASGRAGPWAIRLDAPPLRAYAATGGVIVTFGGLAVNTHARDGWGPRVA